MTKPRKSWPEVYTNGDEMLAIRGKLIANAKEAKRLRARFAELKKQRREQK